MQIVDEQKLLEVKAKEIFMPALSSTMTEGVIVSWLKEPGDRVEVGDMIMTVESDKADMDGTCSFRSSIVSDTQRDGLGGHHKHRTSSWYKHRSECETQTMRERFVHIQTARRESTRRIRSTMLTVRASAGLCIPIHVRARVFVNACFTTCDPNLNSRRTTDSGEL